MGRIASIDQSNGYERLLRNILHIKFSSLKVLDLRNCNLHSFESISFINAPFLESLELIKNKLTRVNGLIKSDFPQLNYLNIYDNYIR